MGRSLKASSQLPPGIADDEDEDDLEVETDDAEDEEYEDEDEDDDEGDDNSADDAVSGQVMSPDDLAKMTAEQGNMVLPMSKRQRDAYNELLEETRNQLNAGDRQLLISRWHLGRAAAQLRADAASNGATYGNATVDGFAKDIGRDRSLVYRAIALSSAVTLELAQRMNVTLEAADLLIGFRGTDEQRNELVEQVVASTEEAAAPVGKAAVQEMINEFTANTASDEPAEREQGENTSADTPFGTNSATGTNHKQVLKRILKALSEVEAQIPNSIISFNEFEEDDMSVRGFNTVVELCGEIKAVAQTVISLLPSFAETADEKSNIEPRA